MEPLLCGQNAVDLNCDILKLRATAFIKELRKLVPWSVRMALGAPKRHIKFRINASATSVAVVVFRGIAREYLVSRSWIVRKY